MNKPNPIVQIFYLVIAGGGFYIYVTVGFFKYVPGPYVSGYHCYTGTIIMLVCYYSLFMASVVDPGSIKDKNEAKIAKKLYRFDDLMYIRNNKCITCDFDKPARSKHCSVCNVCIEKFDHHCIWINNCVGRKNYKYFLTFLGLHIIITAYGAVIGVLIFFGEKQKKVNQGLYFYHRDTQEKIESTFWIHARYFFLNEEKYFGLIVLICTVITPVLFGFFWYHLGIAKNNMTTNESYKIEGMSKKSKWQLGTIEHLIK